MKTTELIELQKTITQGDWKLTGSRGSLRNICVGDDQICGVDLALVKVGERWKPDMAQTDANARAIALTPKLIAEVIKLREALRTISTKLEAQELGYMPKELWPNTRSEMILSAEAVLAND